jgi:hypothetical protein
LNFLIGHPAHRVSANSSRKELRGTWLSSWWKYDPWNRETASLQLRNPTKSVGVCGWDSSRSFHVIASRASHVYKRLIFADFPPRRPGSISGQVMRDLWWVKWQWGRFPPSTSVSLANSHSTKCYIFIYHTGLVQLVADGPSGLSLTPTQRNS